MTTNSIDYMANQVRVNAIHAYPVQVGDSLGTCYVAGEPIRIGQPMSATFIGATPVDIVYRTEHGTKVVRAE